MNKNSIQRFISHLKVTERVKSQEDFALTIGYKSKSAFSSAISKDPISQETINKINKVYPEFKTWESSVISSDDVQDYIFEKASLENKLKMIFEQNAKVLKQYSEIKELISKQSLENIDHKNVLIEYVDFSLQPIMEFIGVNKKQKENK